MGIFNEDIIVKKTLLICAAVGGIVSGCASSSKGPRIMEDNQYAYLVTMRVAVNECLDSGFINPKLAQQALSAESYFRSSFAYDPQKYRDLHDYLAKEVKGKAEAKSCRRFEMMAHEMISAQESQLAARREQRLMQHQYDLQASAIRQQEAMQNKPTTCYNYGNMTQCF